MLVQCFHRVNLGGSPFDIGVAARTLPAVCDMKPRRIDLVNSLLAIVWDDGHESYYEPEALRRACPCALCKGEATALKEYRPAPPQYTPASFELTGFEHVGSYAIQPHWADGHSSGIYSFDYLRGLPAG